MYVLPKVAHYIGACHFCSALKRFLLRGAMHVSVCQVHGFKGNSEDYYHPDNSCINRVLETNQGKHSCIACSLSALQQLHGKP